MTEKSPWPDYAGNPIFAGDIIEHPSGQCGKVVDWGRSYTDPHDRWRVEYDHGGPASRLSLQIGDKGQAVVTGSVHQDHEGKAMTKKLAESVVSEIMDLIETDGGLVKSRAVERVEMVLGMHEREDETIVNITVDSAKSSYCSPGLANLTNLAASAPTFAATSPTVVPNDLDAEQINAIVEDVIRQFGAFLDQSNVS